MAEKRCPICGVKFTYQEGYEPSTCHSYKCTRRWLHRQFYFDSRREAILDEEYLNNKEAKNG